MRLDILRILYNLWFVDKLSSCTASESTFEHILERRSPWRHRPKTGAFSLGDSFDLQAAWCCLREVDGGRGGGEPVINTQLVSECFGKRGDQHHLSLCGFFYLGKLQQGCKYEAMPWINALDLWQKHVLLIISIEPISPFPSDTGVNLGG